MNDPAGVAFIGGGFIAYLHVLAIRGHARARLVAVASRSKRVAENRARIFGVKPYTFDNLDPMLSRADVDIVYVQSPNVLHAEHALRAIGAGKHVMLEKPMTVTIDEAARVVSAARAAGVQVGYAENHVFAPVMQRARELVATGRIGRVQKVTGVFGHGGPPRNTWYWQADLAGGGSLFDLGPHTLETALFLAGKPAIAAVESCRLTPSEDGSLDVKSEIVLRSTDGIEFELTNSWLEANDSAAYDVVGSEARLRAVFSPDPQSLTLHSPNGAAEEIDFPGRFQFRLDVMIGSMGYSGLLAHVEGCCRAGTPPSESGVDGHNVLRLLTAAYLAAGQRGTVDLSREIPARVRPIDLWLHA